MEDEKHIATLENGDCKADIFTTAMPGQFNIRYCRQDGTVLGEETLSGLSTYRQREDEIQQRLQEICEQGRLEGAPLADAGEY